MNVIQLHTLINDMYTYSGWGAFSKSFHCMGMYGMETNIPHRQSPVHSTHLFYLHMSSLLLLSSTLSLFFSFFSFLLTPLPPPPSPMLTPPHLSPSLFFSFLLTPPPPPPPPPSLSPSQPQCDRTQSLDMFHEAVRKRDGEPFVQNIAIIGAGCSIATLPVAEICHYYNLPMVSQGSWKWETRL